MSRSPAIDAARVELMLAELRLSAMKATWSEIAAQSDKEGWPAARFLAALAEHEMADRSRRRIARHMHEAELPEGKSVDAFEFELMPMVSKAQVKALIAGDSWLKAGANPLLFGGQGVGKSHLAAAIDRLVHHATIFEMNVESYRARKARERERAAAKSSPSDNQDGA